ncbi:MAG: Rrf2 family transcriptional regulator [Candidatus Margulisbacteria bacterium]|nr:Rrf2 family transcriptional regulator [Candidatus Margulisiibacteriota bacterium]
MRFSIKIQYGLQAMLELALNYGGGPVQIKTIARDQKIPIRFLEQLIIMLRRAGLVSSSRGKYGGHSLAKRPSEISVLGVIEALEGPVELASKKMKRSPILFEAFEKIQQNLNKQLSLLTLEEITLKKRQSDLSINYQI